MTTSDYLKEAPDGLYSRPSRKWTAEKLDYVHRYIDTFETSMKNKWPERNYIDLFAGPGKNHLRSISRYFLGSPLIALSTKYPFTGYFFCDNNPRISEVLGQRCSASPLVDRVKIYTHDANDIITTIVGSIRQFSPSSLNLAFLDPEGLELKWATVAELGSLRCDLIIYYPQQGLERNIAKMYQIDHETIIDRFFGTSEWRDLFRPWFEKPNKIGLHRELIDFYKERLGKLGYIQIKQPDYALSEPLMRSTEHNAPLYRLIFASKHTRGEDFWQKINRRDFYGQKQLF
jgi:three-Cys-motif partner protein